MPGFTREAISGDAKASLVRGSRILSDGLGRWNGPDGAGMKHARQVTGGGRPREGELKWAVDTVLANIKSAIVGTCRSCDIPHTPRCLAACEWRFNRRRFDLEESLGRLARVAVTTAPKPCRQIAAVRPKPADTLG